jgi:hypothetical protein
VSQRPEQLAVEAAKAETPMLRLCQRVQELLLQVKVDRQSVDPLRVSRETTLQLLALQSREKAFEDVLAEIERIQNGSEDPNKVLDFLGADELPPYHDAGWVE